MDQTDGQTGAVSRLLKAWGRGDLQARDDLVPVVYRELQRRAGAYLRRERSDHTLQPTALVHEAFMRLMGQDRVAWQNRAHFFAMAAQMMRRILVDHARAHGAAKRGDGQAPLALDEALVAAPSSNVDVLALDEGLTRLAALDPQQARVVELRFFGGLTMEETAVALRISPATVGRDWALAKAWLYAELSGHRR